MSQLFPTAKPRNVAPYRNDVVGSFLRTDTLMNAKAKLNAGEISQDEYDVILKDEIGKLVAKQKENGLHAVTDVEFSRVWWHLDFMAEWTVWNGWKPRIFRCNLKMPNQKVIASKSWIRLIFRTHTPLSKPIKS